MKTETSRHLKTLGPSIKTFLCATLLAIFMCCISWCHHEHQTGLYNILGYSAYTCSTRKINYRCQKSIHDSSFSKLNIAEKCMFSDGLIYILDVKVGILENVSRKYLHSTNGYPFEERKRLSASTGKIVLFNITGSTKKKYLPNLQHVRFKLHLTSPNKEHTVEYHGFNEGMGYDLLDSLTLLPVTFRLNPKLTRSNSCLPGTFLLSGRGHQYESQKNGTKSQNEEESCIPWELSIRRSLPLDNSPGIWEGKVMLTDHMTEESSVCLVEQPQISIGRIIIPFAVC